MISGSLFANAQGTPLQLPSASKIPAKKPRDHSSPAESGQRISSRMRSTLSRDEVRIALIGRWRSLPSRNWNSSVRTPSVAQIATAPSEELRRPSTQAGSDGRRSSSAPVGHTSTSRRGRRRESTRRDTHVDTRPTLPRDAPRAPIPISLLFRVR